MRCWYCGAEPELCETTTLADPEPTYVAGRWPAPAEGHEYAIEPPTPGQLEQAGHETLARIQRLTWPSTRRATRVDREIA